ncbi:MAG: glycosyltransferase [bacterium]
MFKGESIIIFSSDDWDSGLKTSKYHIAIRLARENRVLFINSVGLKKSNISLFSLSKVINRIIKCIKGCKIINKNLYVYTPFVLPLQSKLIIQKLNNHILTKSIKFLKKRLNLHDPIIFIFTPRVVDVVGNLNEKGVVYYCIDELTGYKNINEDNLRSSEKRLLETANCVIACSASLANAKQKLNKNTFYVPHGVDWELFRSAFEKDLSIPDDIAKINKPIIGFYGYISEEWIDLSLLKGIARMRPDWSIVLIGKSALDLTELAALKNIHFLGVKPFEELPRYTKAFDVAIIPFNINKLTLNSNPLKLLEYLAAGKPVVSVDIPEVAKHKDVVRIENTLDGFVKAIEQLLKEDSLEYMYKRSDYVRNESWNSRIETISEIVEKHVLNIES